MEFEVTEIKMLGTGIGRSLSLRLNAASSAKTVSSGCTKAAYTIHAVVPYSSEFGTVQIGQKFIFERVEKTLQERQATELVTNQLGRVLREDLSCDEAGCTGDPSKGTMVHNVGCPTHKGKSRL